VTIVSRPLRTGLAAAAALAVAAAAAAGSALPASARELTPAARTPSAAEWWLPALDMAAAWRAAPAAGHGVTVAVLSTGVDGGHPDLTGTVTTGPDFAKTGRGPGQAYWAYEGTAVAGLIAGHGHGADGSEGITGIAPGARILSVQVTLEYNDPLDLDSGITGRIPDAIAAGIRYAVGRGATVVSLPLDPATMGIATPSSTASADGSRAERAAIAYAISRDVVLVAPAGDNGGAGDAVNYPAAYPGVIAVGATARDGDLAPFTNTGSYVALTAPGAAGPPVALDPGGTAGPPVGLTVAAPDGGYQTLASTDMGAALTAGVAALIRGRYPWLTAAEVTRAIEDGATAAGSGPAGSNAGPGATAGWGRGALNAGNALARAAVLAAAHPRPAPAAPAPTPTAITRPAAVAAPTHPAATVRPGDPGGALRSVLLDLLVAVGVLIAGLIGALTVTWVRRRRRAARADDAARDGRGRGPGRHSRAQPPPPLPALQRPPDPDPGPRTPPRAAIGAGSAWVSANPSARPSAGRPADGPLAPWEQSPSEYASAPVPKAPPPWPLSSTGPMYVWNPAATTGPLRPVEEEDQDL
jgi:subtilisin family serine protease